MSELFHRFAGENSAIRQLGMTNLFQPGPFEESSKEPHLIRFVPKRLHKVILVAWDDQLASYRAQLSRGPAAYRAE